MKLLFDQNISFRILKLLPEGFEGSSHIIEEGLLNADDEEIWTFAKQKGFMIVTQDSDFNDLTNLNGFPPKVIWIRIGNHSTLAISKLLNDYTSEIHSFQRDGEYGCFEITRLKM